MAVILQALLALRFFVGIGLGGAHVPIALYMEYVPNKHRGVMLVALQSFWTLGTMIEVSSPRKLLLYSPHDICKWQMD